MTIAASDSSSSEESDTDDKHGEGPSSSHQPSASGHHGGTDQSQQQSQQQQPTATSSSSPDYWIHVLGHTFPPRRGFVPDAAWSAADCRILAVIESKYDALRYKQYQADFFNATGRMVSADLIRAKMARDACPLVPSSSSSSSSAAAAAAATAPHAVVEAEAEAEIVEDANDISSPPSSSSSSSSDNDASWVTPTEASDSG